MRTFTQWRSFNCADFLRACWSLKRLVDGIVSRTLPLTSHNDRLVPMYAGLKALHGFYRDLSPFIQLSRLQQIGILLGIISIYWTAFPGLILLSKCQSYVSTSKGSDRHSPARSHQWGGAASEVSRLQPHIMKDAIWCEQLGHAVNKTDDLQQNLDRLRQTLLH